MSEIDQGNLAGDEDTSAGSAVDENLWGDLASSIDHDDGIEETPLESGDDDAVAEPPASEEEPLTPAEPAAAEESAEPEKPAEPAAPAEPEAPAGELTEEQAQAQAQQALQEWRTSLQAAYAVPDEMVEQLRVEPEKALPLLAATLHENIFNGVVGFMNNFFQNQLPGMLQNMTTQQETQRTGTQKFYEAYPELQEHHQLVNAVAKDWMGRNPQATLDDFIKNVGAAAWVQAGLPLDQLMAKMSGETPAPAPKPKPTIGLSPNEPGGSTPVQPSKTNIYEELALTGMDDL